MEKNKINQNNDTTQSKKEVNQNVNTKNFYSYIIYNSNCNSTIYNV